MSMIPWEEAALVPPADLSLPVWLQPTAAAVGFAFPDVSERAMFALGHLYAGLARKFERDRERVDEGASSVLDTNHGAALIAFAGFRERLSGPNASHMILSATAAGVISTAYLGAAWTVVGMKLKVIATLADTLARSEAVTALAVAKPATAPLIAEVRAGLAVIVAELNKTVLLAQQAVTTLLRVATQALGLYMSVATPLLKNRPMARQRETATYMAVTGGLASHEESSPDAKDGGHTLSKHVNVTDQNIIDRVRNRKAKESSRWLDRRTAERVIAEVIAANPRKIENWLASGDPNNLELHLAAGGATTGRYVKRGNLVPQEVSGAGVVLKRDASRPNGYIILTAFPEP